MAMADTLKKLRRQRGLSQNDLAHAAGIPADTIRALEQGKILDPRLSTISRLATALDVPLDEFKDEVQPSKRRSTYLEQLQARSKGRSQRRGKQR
jgi:transcriptional regulator with XRE-family HTH domain